MVYILGFFAADGYITVNKRGGQFWSIQITDQKLLEQIKEVVGSEHKIGIRKGRKNESTLFRLQIGSIEMCNDLRSLGYKENKTKSLSLPYIPAEYFFDFIRGYFDGDGNVWVGYINKKRAIPTLVINTEFTSCSKNFLKTLKKRLEDFGVVGGSLICKNGYFKLKYSINNSKAIYGLMYDKKKELNLYLPRKKIVFDNYLKIRSGSSTG